MAPLAFLALLFAAWLVLTGRLKRMTTLDGAMLGLALVGSLMAAKGRVWVGGGLVAMAAIYAVRRLRRTNRKPSAQVGRESPQLAEARALLGLDLNYDEAVIREAHRRLIAKVHPDAGGTSALAEKINEARNILLHDLAERRRSQSSPNP